jgi:hypothetical protein
LEEVALFAFFLQLLDESDGVIHQLFPGHLGDGLTVQEDGTPHRHILLAGLFPFATFGLLFARWPE